MRTNGFGITNNGGSSSGGIQSVVAGTNITVDNTDPENPIVSTTAEDFTVVANYSALPDPTTVSGQFYFVEDSQGTKWLWGSLGGTYYPAGTYYSNGTTWKYEKSSYQATQATVNTGTNDDQFVTPLTLTNSTQLQYLDATSSIQTQLDNKLATFDFWNILPYATVDGATVYFATNYAMNSTGTVGFQTPLPLASGKIVKVLVGVYSSASLASAELGTLTLLTTTTTRFDTPHLISSSVTFETGTNRQNFQSFTVDIDVSQGMSCMQLELPTFATNPTIQMRVILLMRLS